MNSSNEVSAYLFLLNFEVWGSDSNLVCFGTAQSNSHAAGPPEAVGCGPPAQDIQGPTCGVLLSISKPAPKADAKLGGGSAAGMEMELAH